MKSYDIVGYTNDDGECICTDCVKKTKGLNPVFVDESGWEEMVCDKCSETLESVAG